MTLVSVLVAVGEVGVVWGLAKKAAPQAATNILISSSMVLTRFSRCGGVECFAGTQYANLTFDYMCSAVCTLGMKTRALELLNVLFHWS